MSSELPLECQTIRNFSQANFRWETSGLSQSKNTCLKGIHSWFKTIAIFCGTEGNEKTEEVQLTHQVFSNPYILMEVLKNLNIQDLLQTSLLNKHWNFFSREFLQKNKKCLVRFNRNGITSKRSLKQLQELLLKSDVVPFNGIALAHRGKYHSCTAFKDTVKLVKNVLKKVNIKYLELYNVQSWVEFETCATLKCCQQILKSATESLEGLCLYVDIHTEGTFLKLFGLDLKGDWLPNLRLLQFSTDNYRRFPPGILKDLVEASPNLEALHGYIDVEHLELEFILPLKKAKAVKDFRFIPTIESLDNCQVFSEENPQLRKLKLTTDVNLTRFSEWNKSRQRRVYKILKQLLESSEECIEFECDHANLILITSQWNIQALKNVTHLKLRYCKTIDDREGCSTLGKINWPEYFPNLKEVSPPVSYDFDVNHIHFCIDDYFRGSKATFVCKSVIKLWLQTTEYANEQTLAQAIQTFSKVFPNVKDLYVPRCFVQCSILDKLWGAWPNVETLRLEIHPRSGRDYDFVLQGIAVEAMFGQGDVKCLELFEVDSIKPSIFNFRNLKKLVLQVFGDEFTSRKSNRAEVVFGIADKFSNIPEVTVEIYLKLFEDDGLEYLYLVNN